MKSIFFIAALCSINLVNAQQLPVPVIKTDTTVQRPKLKPFTGFDIIREENRRIKSLFIPAGLIAYGFIALENDGLKKLDNNTKLEIWEDHPAFITKLDNYLQYSPALAVYGLNALGVKRKNNFRDRTIIYGLSTIISSAIVLPLKKITKVQRPDASGFNSFPSGHTTTAFAAAEFLRMEYKDVSPWYGIAGYAVATTTGVLRLYNNKHWVSDVVAGAGFGILSTKLAYWIYPSIKRKFFKNKPMNTMVMPYYQSGGGGLALVYNFRH
ncbi:MAG: phosphatase PAP2 family protein [Chitinophagaceae bacterium]|nr:phosphatase PAP2 family protein [Chitinophagaceae bacterium]